MMVRRWIPAALAAAGPMLVAAQLASATPPPPAVTFAAPAVSGTGAVLTFTVNRAPSQIRDRACRLRRGDRVVSADCGTRVAATGASATYRVAFTGLTPGGYSYRVVVALRGPDAQGTTAFTIAAPVNRPPVAVPDRYGTPAGTPLVVAAPGVLANDTDPDGDRRFARLVAGPGHGTLTLRADGSLRYVPAAGYTGTDTFRYAAVDAHGAASAPTPVNVTVQAPPNRPPVAVPDGYGTHAGTTLDVRAPGVLGNDTDPERDPLTAIPQSSPAHGTLTLHTDGSFSYAPAQGYSGPDAFTYSAVDSRGAISPAATVTITVANRPPVARDMEFTVHPGVPFILPGSGLPEGATDPDGDPISVVLPLESQPQHGDLFVSPDPPVRATYVANPGYVGDDTARYRLRDSLGALSNVATVTFHVVNRPPVARDMEFTVHPGVPFFLPGSGLPEGATDPDGDPISVVLPLGSQPQHGDLFVSPDPPVRATYVANPGYVGDDTARYRLRDSLGALSNVATVTFHVVNAPPVAVADAYPVAFNQTLSVPAPGVLGNDSDPENQPLSYLTVTGPRHGIVFPHADGSFTYEPDRGYSGPDSYTYSAVDSLGAVSAPATVSITVMPNQPPV